MDVDFDFSDVDSFFDEGEREVEKVIVYSIYRDAFFNFRFGGAAAQSVVLFLIVMLLTLLMFRLEKKGVKY